MSQEAIWDHFQNEGIDSFSAVGPRTEYLLRQLSLGEVVLNIGVGSAALERLALAKGIDIWCLDPSERTIANVREALNLGEKAQAGYSQRLPFPDQKFDAVIMSEVLEHLEPEVLNGTLHEVWRVLRPGGRFIGTVPAREDLSQSIVVCPACEHKFHRWGHHSSFSEQVLTDTLAGLFSEVRVEDHFFILWDSASWTQRFKGIIKKLLSWRRIGTYGTSRNFAFSAVRRN